MVPSVATQSHGAPTLVCLISLWEAGMKEEVSPLSQSMLHNVQAPKSYVTKALVSCAVRRSQVTLSPPMHVDQLHV